MPFVVKVILLTLLYIVIAIVCAALSYVLVLTVSALLVDKKKIYKTHSRYYRTLLNSASFLATKLLRIRIHLSGQEKLPEHGRFLLVQNHRSNFDPILTWHALMKYDLAFISKGENLNIPIFGRIIRRCCFMSIDRENAREALKTLLDAAEIVSNDQVSMAIYPEGTRNHGEELLPFHNGVLKIAQKAKVPVVITCIKNADKIAGRAPWKSTDVYIDIIDVIPADVVVKTGTAVMGDDIREKITATYAMR